MNRKHTFCPAFYRNVSNSSNKALSILRKSLVLILLLGMASPAFAVLTIKNITWNTIGLDSNNVNVGPNQFPVGARVCTNVTVSNLSATFAWNTTPSPNYITITPGTSTTIGVPSLAAGTCTDFYYSVDVVRSASAYNEFRDYTITVTATGSPAVSTPQRRLYIEHLISQNRNTVYVSGMSYGATIGSLAAVARGGEMRFMVGNTYFIRVLSSTATQGYENIESFLSLPNNVFQVLSVATTYTADTSFTVSSPNDKVYGDACTWESDFNDPNYRSCLSTGKVGGDMSTTYKVKIVGSPTGVNPLPLSALIYDFSGSSYHYNADFDASGRFARIISADIIKAFSPKTILPGENSTLTFTIDNPGSAALTNVNFTDALPANLNLTNGNIIYTNCGTPSPTSGSLINPLSFTNITVAGFGTCKIAVTVTSSNTAGSPYVNTTGNLFINGTAGVPGSGTNTLSTGTDTLVVTSKPAPPSSCAAPTTIATWTMPTTGTGSGGPPPPFTTKVADVSTALASYTTVSGAQSISATGNPTNSWSGTAPTGGTSWAETAATSANYFQLQVDTSNYGGVSISVDVNPVSPGDWANPISNVFIKSSTNGTAFTTYEVTPGVYPQARKNSWTVISDIPAAATGTASTWFRLSVDGSKKTTAAVLLDNILIKGCPRPLVPTLSKVFGTDPIVQGNSSTLTFSLTNPNTTALTGVTFSDVLPTGLSIATTPNVVNTCGSMAVTAPAATSTISATGSLTASQACTIKVDVKGVDAGDYTNISGNISSTSTGPNTTAAGYGTDTLSVVATPVISKNFSPASIFTGGTTTLSFIINNPNPPGTTTLNGITFTDTLPAGLDIAAGSTSNVCGTGSTLTRSNSNPDTIVLSGGTLAAGASCTFSVAVTGNTVGLKTNNVTVAFDNGGGVSGTGNTSTDTVLVENASPGIGLLKQIGPTADGPWANYIAVIEGADVYYRFQVENTGDVALASVNISDPGLTAPSTTSCAWQNGDGTSLSAPFSLPIADADEGHLAICVLGAYTAVAGGITNTATTSNGSGAANASDSAEYAITALSLDKTVTGGSPYTVEGDTITYDYLVTNTGTSTLIGPLSIADNKIASVDCSGYGVSLVPSASFTCTASYTVTATDMANDAVTNIATATLGGVESNSDTVTVSTQPTAVTINSVGLELISVSHFLSTLGVDGMPVETLMALLAAWDPDLARLMAGADRPSVLDALGDYLDPDGDGQVALLRWDTLEEHGTIGFYVDRRQDDLNWHLVNHHMLPGMMTAPMGAEYMLADPEVAEPGIYLYRLIEQEAWGSTRTYGPYQLEIQR